jgi:hypothetical protein
MSWLLNPWRWSWLLPEPLRASAGGFVCNLAPQCWRWFVQRTLMALCAVNQPDRGVWPVATMLGEKM